MRKVRANFLKKFFQEKNHVGEIPARAFSGKVLQKIKNFEDILEDESQIP